MTRVKICGLTNAEDRDVAVDAGADAVGFVVDVSVDTPREIDAGTAADLVDGTPPLVTSVLVTMPAAVQPAVRLQERVGADAIQVHGTLSPQYLAGLRERVDCDVIAGIDADAPDANAYAEAADALLVDSTDDDGGGGTGETHDWKRTRELVDRVEVPVVVAGGLTPENVADAVEATRPFGVDTATGVERTGGRKDHGAVRQFVAEARRTEVAA